MKPQNWEIKRRGLEDSFARVLRDEPALKDQSLKLSWSNWGFGIEPLATSAARLQQAGIEWIELHGNRYGDDLGYQGR
jgi:D-psicose/D-tagatose/L-ribulose 3-epimerase